MDTITSQSGEGDWTDQNGASHVEHMIGSTCVTIFDGKRWPVVLCSDVAPPEVFMRSRSSPYNLPAVLLGKHKYIWVRQTSLRRIDPFEDYSDGLWECKGDYWFAMDRNDRSEQLRCKAFKQDVVHWKGDAWWNNYLANERGARGLSDDAPKSKRKRNVQEDEDDSDGFEVIAVDGVPRNGWSSAYRSQLATPETTPSKRKRSRSNWHKDQHVTELSDNSPVVDQAFATEDGEEQEDYRSLDDIRHRHKQEVIDKGHNYNQCAIFVGEEHKPFFLSRDDVGKCDFLGDLVHFDQELRSHINLYEDTDITAEQFEPVHEYLKTKEFKPRLFSRENSEQLEGVFMPEDKDEAAMKLVGVYATSAKLHFDALQERCVRKLQALYPLSALSLMLLVKSSENVESQTGNRDEHLRAWLVDHTAEQFFKLYEQNHMTMTRLMEEYPDFREDVIDRLSVHRDARMREMT